MTDTTNDVAVQDDGDNNDPDAGTLEIFPPARPREMAALGTLDEHVETMRKAVYFAEGMCYTEMVPQRFRGKPKDAAAAILFGAEVGLTPIAALRSVIVIHGMPGFEARTMKAILKAKRYGFRTIEKTATRAELWAWEPDSPKVYGTDPEDKLHYGQRINPDETAVWTIEDAVQAGFVPVRKGTGWETNSNGKLKGNMKYIETPKVMLEAKVTAEACRAIAPHILLGLPHAAEELSEFNDASEAAWRGDGDADDPRADAPRGGVDVLREKAAASKRKRKPAAPKEEPVDTDEVPIPEPEPAAPAPAPAEAAEPTPAVPDQPPAETSPAPPEADPTPDPVAGKDYSPTSDPNWTPPAADDDTPPTTAAQEPDPEPEPAAEPAGVPAEDVPAAGDIAMTAAVRSKGVDMLVGLLINADVAEADRWAGVAEVLAKRPEQVYRPITGPENLLNVELKFVVDTLRAWKEKEQLVQWMTEAVNTAALREAGVTIE